MDGHLYRILNKASNTWLDLDDASSEPRTGIYGYGEAKGDERTCNQIWRLSSTKGEGDLLSDSYWRLINARSGTYTDLDDGDDHGRVYGHGKSTNFNQWWKVTRDEDAWRYALSQKNDGLMLTYYSRLWITKVAHILTWMMAVLILGTIVHSTLLGYGIFLTAI